MHIYNIVWSYVHNSTVYLFTLGQPVSPLTSYPLFKTTNINNIMSMLSGDHMSTDMGPFTGDG